MTHDAKGNVTYDPTTGYTHGYSSENLLRNVSGSGWAGTLTYDPLMRLYDAGAGGRTRFVYDGDDRIAEYSSNGSQVARFVHGPGIDEPLIEYTGSSLGTRRFTHADERGSIVAVSNDSGSVTAIGRYDEQGRTQSFASYRFGYAGQPYETLTELYYSRARMYNERLPRFMQPDPIGYAGGINLYNRTKGDPVNFTDPMGLCGVGEVPMRVDRSEPGNAGEVTALYHYRCVSIRTSNGGGNGMSGGLGGGEEAGGEPSFPLPCNGEPGPCIDPQYLPKWYYRQIRDGARRLVQKGKAYLNNCWNGLDEVSAPKLGEDVQRGVATGAARGALRGGLPGALRGGLTGAVSGGARSVVKQACSAGNR